MNFNRLACAAAIVTGVLLARVVPAQSPSPIGVWRGTSKCLVQPSPCHDEVTVYRITRTTAADSVSLDAFKIVNGQEQDMGTLTCHATTTVPQLTCNFPRGVWSFTVRGDSLVGELRLPDGTKFRNVRAARSR